MLDFVTLNSDLLNSCTCDEWAVLAAIEASHSTSVRTMQALCIRRRDRVSNFPGFSYLGSVNLQRDILKTVVAFAGAAYAGLHLSAWNTYFPTRVEMIMWIACACAMGLTGLILALFFLATNKLQQLEATENSVRNNKRFKPFLKGVLVP